MTNEVYKNSNFRMFSKDPNVLTSPKIMGCRGDGPCYSLFFFLFLPGTRDGTAQAHPAWPVDRRCASGALVAGFALVPRRYGSPLVAARGQHVVDSYLKLACDGTLSVAVPACEMGQG
jgi:hypothetical protein